jgi:hypothetical protein
MKRFGSTLDNWVKKKPKFEPSYLTLPNSPKNEFKSGDKTLEKWYLIETVLSDKIQNYSELVDVLKTLNKDFDMYDCECFEECITDEFINNTLPLMQEMALKLPDLCKEKIPLLKKGMDDEVTLTRMQIASFLCHGFFNTWPSSRYHKYPQINFLTLFKNTKKNNIEKFKTILHYFESIPSSFILI